MKKNVWKTIVIQSTQILLNHMLVMTTDGDRVDVK